MLLVSDNNAYSRMYEFLGADYILSGLSKIELPKIVIRHRFDAKCTEENNMLSNPIFFQKNKNYFFLQSAYKSTTKYNAKNSKAFVGRANINNEGKKIMKPKNFSAMNYFRLQDVDEVLKRLIFPIIFEPDCRFNLTTNDYNFLRKYMSMLPRESDYPAYSDSLYEDSYKKYLLYGNVHGTMHNDSVRIFNIVGQSYGFLSDCAYIVNFKKGIEFFISAVIYVNEDGVINDGKYEYKSIGFPFLSKLGKAFYLYEANRVKENFPNLNEFIFDYK
jgi:hypothetical protein